MSDRADELLREWMTAREKYLATKVDTEDEYAAQGELMAVEKSVRAYLNEKPHEPPPFKECLGCSSPHRCEALQYCPIKDAVGEATRSTAPSQRGESNVFAPASPPHAAAEKRCALCGGSGQVNSRDPNRAFDPCPQCAAEPEKPIGWLYLHQKFGHESWTRKRWERHENWTETPLYASPSAQPTKVEGPPTNPAERKIWDVFQRVGGLAIPDVWRAFRKGWKESEYAAQPIAREDGTELVHSQYVRETTAEIRRLKSLLIEARGHLRGYKMSMLARGRESLLKAIDDELGDV